MQDTQKDSQLLREAIFLDELELDRSFWRATSAVRNIGRAYITTSSSTAVELYDNSEQLHKRAP